MHLAFTLDRKMKEPSNSPPKSKKTPLYTQGGYDKHLNYKMWSTSGARFSASARLKLRHKNSTAAISILSAYLIIYALYDFIFFSKSLDYNPGISVFVSVCFSILILVFNQIESGSNYSVRSMKPHQCAMEISDLYKSLRLLKSKLKKDEDRKDIKDEEFWKKVEEIDQSYSNVLKRYENHDPIDTKVFRASRPKYEDHNLNWFQV